ncbi:SUF system Fe-S cluster assembly regulator [bacterium TMED181]|nr:SUF system Fe-S cluster assembly regulator [Planctomycetota bacterium]OUW43131.1 MAG: SUF system Fe-S cluster assembly regulator [bacterium TMED181]
MDMLRLNRQTDYGIMILTCLVREDDALLPARLLSAPEIATASGLALPNVSKILKALVRGGILESRRGVQGGYQLSRLPKDISVQQVIAALDGPISMTDCAGEGPDHCDVSSLCPMSANWKYINDKIVETLENITLEQMAIPGGVLAAANDDSDSNNNFEGE